MKRRKVGVFFLCGKKTLNCELHVSEGGADRDGSMGRQRRLRRRRSGSAEQWVVIVRDRRVQFKNIDLVHVSLGERVSECASDHMSVVERASEARRAEQANGMGDQC